jgi:predicted CoA-binding protein
MTSFTTLVLGASTKPDRYAYKAIVSLRNHYIDVVAIGKREGVVADVTIQKELTAFKNIHTITLYLNPSNQVPYYDYILSLMPKRVIFNPGTENADLQKKLRESHIAYEEACTLVMLSIGNYKTL